jgi:hypothetical protein
MQKMTAPTRPRRALPAALLLATLALAGCAAGQGGGGGADPGSIAVANRLPERIGGWERSRRPDGDAVSGVMVGYRLGPLPAWATVQVAADPSGAPVPDGPAAPLVLQLRPELRAETAPPGARRLDFAPIVPGAPRQSCILRITEQAGHYRNDYTCGTGAGGRAVMTRITVDRIPRADPRDMMAAITMSHHLVQEIARNAAGLPPAR